MRGQYTLIIALTTLVASQASAQTPRPIQAKALSVFRSLGRARPADFPTLHSKHRWRDFGRRTRVRSSLVPATRTARALRYSFRALAFEPELTLEARDRVFVVGTMTAQQRRKFRKVPSRGANVQADVLYIGMVRDGQIVESSAYFGGDAVVSQLRVATAPRAQSRQKLQHGVGLRLNKAAVLDLYRVAAFAYAARLSGKATLTEQSFRSLKIAEATIGLADMKDLMQRNRMRIARKEVHVAGAYAIARYEISRHAGQRTVRTPVFVVAEIRANKVLSAQAFFDL